MFVSEDEKRQFAVEHGIDTLPWTAPTTGVAADWGMLESTLATVLPGMASTHGELELLSSGIAGRTWKYVDASRRLNVRVAVSGAGLRAIRDHLVERGTSHSMMSDPYGPAPFTVGETTLTIRSSPTVMVMWIYQNVFVQLHEYGTGVALEPVAQALQRFLSAAVVQDLPKYIPSLQATIHPTRIAVSEELSVSVRPSAPSRPLSALIVREHPPTLLRALAKTGDDFRFLAENPGKTTLSVIAVDETTLLSPAVELSAEVLEAKH